MEKLKRLRSILESAIEIMNVREDRAEEILQDLNDLEGEVLELRQKNLQYYWMYGDPSLEAVPEPLGVADTVRM